MIFDTKLTCPKCECESPFKLFKMDEEFLEILRLASKLGRNWDWVEEYLHCFQSSPDRPLRLHRIKMLVIEILEYIQKAGFGYDGKHYSIRPDAIFAAIRHVAQTNKTGFKNHNYLKKVAIDFNLKMIQKDESEQKKKEEEALKRDPNAHQKIKELMRKWDKE